MKRAEAKVIGTSFFQLHKAANNIQDVQASKYLLYGSLGDQGSQFGTANISHLSAFPGTTKITREGEVSGLKQIIFT